MLFYIVVYLLLLLIAIGGKYFVSQRYIFLFISLFFICVFAGFRGVDVSADGFQYVNMFDKATNYSDFLTSQNEFMATFIPVTLKYLDIYFYWLIFLIFAILAISCKYQLITKYSDFPFLTLLLFYSNFFLLHEMTQIRAAIAIGILILTVENIYQRDLIGFLVKIFIASLFHISSLSFLPVYLFNPKKLNVRLYLMMFIIVFLIGVLKVDVLSYIPFIGVFSKKLDTYLALGQMVNGTLSVVNLFNFSSLINIMMLVLLLKFYSSIIHKNKYAIIFIKLLFCSYAGLFVLRSIPVIAFRVNELFLVSNIVSYTYLCYFVRPIWFAKLVVVLISLVYLYYNLFVVGLLQPYHLIF